VSGTLPPARSARKGVRASPSRKRKSDPPASGGYTNSAKGAKETTLFDIDSGIGALPRQAPPNDGVLASVGTRKVNNNHLE
jgi:hypothetical protein